MALFRKTKITRTTAKRHLALWAEEKEQLEQHQGERYLRNAINGTISTNITAFHDHKIKLITIKAFAQLKNI